MFKPRNKYIYCNYDNLIRRIEEQKTHFTPYEFMSLRYACCDVIAYCYKKWNEWKHFDSRVKEGNHCKFYKSYIKKFQRCINILDKDFNSEKGWNWLTPFMGLIHTPAERKVVMLYYETKARNKGTIEGYYYNNNWYTLSRSCDEKIGDDTEILAWKEIRGPENE